MLSIMDCVKEKLIIPVFIGDEIEIKKTAEELKFDISEYEIIKPLTHEYNNNENAVNALK